jgi:hypothetical protein
VTSKLCVLAVRAETATSSSNRVAKSVQRSRSVEGVCGCAGTKGTTGGPSFGIFMEQPKSAGSAWCTHHHGENRLLTARNFHPNVRKDRAFPRLLRTVAAFTNQCGTSLQFVPTFDRKTAEYRRLTRPLCSWSNRYPEAAMNNQICSSPCLRRGGFGW